MKKYNHNYTDGDIITDTEHNEIFTFSDKSDGYRAENAPNKLRLATEEEKTLLQNSGKSFITLPGSDV